MKISSKGRYGLRLMIDLAVHAQERPVSVKEISERQNLSVKYLENIIGLLSKAGLVKSVRGAPVECADEGGDCPKIAGCYTAELWKRIKRAVDEVVDSTTIADLIKGKENITDAPQGC